ncbi:MAG TPA: HNH endonuclease [Acidimicrobiales bacterium]|nr:HNH endonuclease [Acidimicrobiales bacterium]
MSQALVLNATYEPICVVTTRRALMLLLDQKAEMLHQTERFFRSERASFSEPSVVRLRHYVKVPFQSRVALNRRAVFARDGHRCQYCGAAAENIDHVIPRSRGGAHSWDNVVASCRPCNARKRDHLLEETGLRLRRPPTVPRQRTFILVASGRIRSEWEPYLGPAAASLSA